MPEALREVIALPFLSVKCAILNRVGNNSLLKTVVGRALLPVVRPKKRRARVPVPHRGSARQEPDSFRLTLVHEPIDFSGNGFK